MGTVIENEECAGLAEGSLAPRPVQGAAPTSPQPAPTTVPTPLQPAGEPAGRAPLPVLAVGAVMVDAVCHVPRLPGSGEGVVVQSVSATLGGCALNSAAAVLDAGVPCRLFAPLGQGMFAGFVKQRLDELGLEAFRPPASLPRVDLDTEATRWESIPGRTGIAAVDDCGDAGNKADLLPVADGGASMAPPLAEDAFAPVPQDSGACVCFVEPDGQRTMVTLPGIERHFRDEWFADLDVECTGRAEVLKGPSSPQDGRNLDSLDGAGTFESFERPGELAGPEDFEDSRCPDASERFKASDAIEASDCRDVPCGFSCALASGFEIGGAGGRAIVRFFERHPGLLLFFGPGPLLPTFSQDLIDQLNALHPIWHLNDQEALEFTGCETVEEAGRQLADAAGNVCVVTAGARGSYAFFPKTSVPSSGAAAPCASQGVAFANQAISSDEEAVPCAIAAASAPREAMFEDSRTEQEGAARSIFVPSVPVPSSRIADTIGAGDTHLGALAAAFARGMTWEEALAAANGAAARVVQLPGGMLPIT